jgi:hypothetical protein
VHGPQEAFKRREEGLRKKDQDLQEALIRFNTIITENDAKKLRAEKRAGMFQVLICTTNCEHCFNEANALQERKRERRSLKNTR